ncbi:MAG TPA: ADYC domain-containing protein, partial [Polyangia bacterium]|nr:ADYC domain-containing protein [Polyangia bacterium]
MKPKQKRWIVPFLISPLLLWASDSFSGMNIQGMNIQGMPMFGIDRVRGMAGSLEYAGLAFSDGQTSSILQGVQTNAAINYVQVAPPLPRLQAGPAAAGPGSFIYVDSLNGSHTARDLTNSFWNLIVSDSTGQGAIPLYISEVAKDTTTNLSNAPLNDDVYLYTVYYRHPATQQWLSLCPVDEKTGKASAMAIPLNPSDWSSTPSRQKFTFACTASGVGSKCAR